MPDENVFKLAAENRFRKSGVLEQQIERMLKKPKSKALAENFAGQWLKVRDLKTFASSNRKRFPAFTASLRDAMYAEAIEFFYAMLREDRGLLDLLDADYAFVNEELAKLYGIPGVEGAEMRQVK